MGNVFEIEMTKHEPYTIQSLNGDIDWLNCGISLDCFSAYDEDLDEDVLIYPGEGSNISFTIQKSGDDQYDILMSGIVILSDTDRDLVLSKDGEVDFAIDIENIDGDALETDEDFELIENHNIILINQN